MGVWRAADHGANVFNVQHGRPGEVYNRVINIAAPAPATAPAAQAGSAQQQPSIFDVLGAIAGAIPKPESGPVPPPVTTPKPQTEPEPKQDPPAEVPKEEVPEPPAPKEISLKVGYSDPTKKGSVTVTKNTGTADAALKDDLLGEGEALGRTAFGAEEAITDSDGDGKITLEDFKNQLRGELAAESLGLTNEAFNNLFSQVETALKTKYPNIGTDTDLADQKQLVGEFREIFETAAEAMMKLEPTDRANFKLKVEWGNAPEVPPVAEPTPEPVVPTVTLASQESAVPQNNNADNRIVVNFDYGQSTANLPRGSDYTEKYSIETVRFNNNTNTPINDFTQSGAKYTQPTVRAYITSCYEFEDGSALDDATVETLIKNVLADSGIQGKPGSLGENIRGTVTFLRTYQIGSKKIVAKEDADFTKPKGDIYFGHGTNYSSGVSGVTMPTAERYKTVSLDISVDADGNSGTTDDVKKYSLAYTGTEQEVTGFKAVAEYYFNQPGIQDGLKGATPEQINQSIDNFLKDDPAAPGSWKNIALSDEFSTANPEAANALRAASSRQGEVKIPVVEVMIEGTMMCVKGAPSNPAEAAEFERQVKALTTKDELLTFMYGEDGKCKTTTTSNGTTYKVDQTVSYRSRLKDGVVEYYKISNSSSTRIDQATFEAAINTTNLGYVEKYLLTHGETKA